MKKAISLMLVLVLCMVAKGDFTFGTPTNLGPTVNSSDYDFNPSMRADGLELYFISDRPGGEGTYDIWVSTRATKEDDWGAATNLGPPINTPDWQIGPCISPDGLELYWGDWGLWVARRATVSDPWGEPENDSLININTSNVDSSPDQSSDGLSLFLASWDPWDLYVSTRPTREDLWSEPVNLGPTVNGVNSSTWENRGPTISADGLVLFFSSDRDPGEGRRDLWMTRRSTTDGPWLEPVNLGPTINIYKSEYAPEISADGRSLLFCSTRDGGYGDFDIWQAPIIPIVDFNGDGNIDTDDLLIMIDNWNTDNSLCDIGPMPWGDGVVDKEDVEVLMSYWDQKIDDPTLIVHWKLDETEGTTVRDSINNIQAQLYGDPIWQPTDGMVDGALMLDGIDDFVGTWEIPALSSGDFSMFAWIKGGAPGQVVISEFHGVSWLMADASHGYLKTDLKEAGNTAQDQSLVSEVTITDGEWHRIGLTWDGTNRFLLVDDLIVASDAQQRLDRYGIGLNIGCGPYEETGTFFSGLIDDVRIYNRAITP